MRYLGSALLMISGVCLAQPPQPPAMPSPPPTTPKPVVVTPLPPPEQTKYLRFLLLNLASLDHSPDAIAAYEKSLVMQFGLSPVDSDVIHSAGQSLNTVLAQLRQSTQSLVAGKTGLSPADLDALLSLNAQREQTISKLANQILNSVSPATAARLRSAEHVLATAGKNN